MTVVVEKPYQFVPPIRGDLWPTLIQTFRLVDLYLAKHDGVVSHECRHVERFQRSIDAGDSIILAPNHCRYSDPLVLAWPARLTRTHLFAMASWHLFAKSRFDAFAIQKMGGFSIFREGTDRQALDTAIDILTHRTRPLVLFPEGTTNRTNDVLQPLLDGIAFIARTSARRRAKKDDGRVVIHPVGIKYLFKGDIRQWAAGVVEKLEDRLGWRSRGGKPLLDRIHRLAEAMLSIREIEHMGEVGSGPLAHRRDLLAQRLLEHAEGRLNLASDLSLGTLGRVRRLRSAILPVLRAASDPRDKQEWYHTLDGIELAQKLFSYPDRYLLNSPVTDTQILETLERMQEGLLGKSVNPRPLHVVIEFDQAIEVSTDRPPRDGPDPLMQQLEQSLRGLLDRLSREANVIDEQLASSS